MKNKNIRRSKEMLLNAISNYCTWADRNGACIGITVNFEEADDTYCELLAEDWFLFKEKVLRVERSENFDAELSKITEKGCFNFYEKRKEHGIHYKVMSSWDMSFELEDSEEPSLSVFAIEGNKI